MTENKITVLIDSATQLEGIPPLDSNIKCLEHPNTEPEIGFGLAGGGYGVYTLCIVCGRILSKDQEEA